ncbi:nuclear transport factor 2 family protein [Micromonospora chokoriensis]
MDAVARGSKDEWLALFAPDVLMEDPVGPSAWDPQGLGFRGTAGVTAFWDTTIAATQRIEYVIRASFAAGDEVANCGTVISYDTVGNRFVVDGVFLYRVDSGGLVTSLRAFWEVGQSMTASVE